MSIEEQEAVVETLISAKQLSQMSGISKTSIYDFMSRGELPFIRLGWRKWIRLADWGEFLADHYESRHDV
tara:strand:+ start:4273 stop:4482 length:210 start_codon:yes stop_codon:yes gene_type:complete